MNFVLMNNVNAVPSASQAIKTEVVCPNDTNPMGLLLGGKLVQWMDIAAAVSAQTHSGKICVTVSIDNVKFLASARTGDIVTITAKVTCAFTTSMEVYVTAAARGIISGESHKIAEAFFSFVALDSQARPTSVRKIEPVTQEEIQMHKAAMKRRKTDKRN